MADTDTTTMKEEAKEAWDENKAEDYPVHDLDDTAAEEDPANSAGFIGGVADQRPRPEDTKTEGSSDEPEPEAESSDTTSPSAEAGDDAPAIDAGLTSRAHEAGLSNDDISVFNQAQLERVLALHDRAMLRPTSKKEEAEPEPTAAEEDFKIELDPEFHDPDVIKAFKALDQRHQANTKQLQDQVEKLVDHARQQARQSHQETFDSWAASLPEQYAEILGQGPTGELDENGDFFKNRDEVAMAAAAMEFGIIQTGKTPPNRKAMLKRALYAVLGDKVTQIERAIEKKGETKRRSQTTALPSHKRTRDPQQPLGEKAAHAWVANWAHEEGLDAASYGGLPDGQAEGI